MQEDISETIVNVCTTRQKKKKKSSETVVWNYL